MIICSVSCAVRVPRRNLYGMVRFGGLFVSYWYLTENLGLDGNGVINAKTRLWGGLSI